MTLQFHLQDLVLRKPLGVISGNAAAVPLLEQGWNNRRMAPQSEEKNLSPCRGPWIDWPWCQIHLDVLLGETTKSLLLMLVWVTVSFPEISYILTDSKSNRRVGCMNSLTHTVGFRHSKWCLKFHGNTHTHTHTHTSTGKIGGIWVRSVDCFNLNIWAVMLSYSFARCDHWGKLGEVSLYDFLKCVWIYSYLKKRVKDAVDM